MTRKRRGEGTKPLYGREAVEEKPSSPPPPFNAGASIMSFFFGCIFIFVGFPMVFFTGLSGGEWELAAVGSFIIWIFFVAVFKSRPFRVGFTAGIIFRDVVLAGLWIYYLNEAIMRYHLYGEPL